MSRLILSEQASTPSTPSAGKVAVFVDNIASPNLKTVDDLGVVTILKQINANGSTSNQTGFAADVYLAGSNCMMMAPPKIGTTYRCVFDLTKTGAGTATPIIIVRFGTAGSVADTARATFTFAAGTAAIDTGMVEIYIHFRSVGASGVITGAAKISHHLAATGLTATGASGTGIILVTSGAFDTTVASSFLGVSVNGGTSFAGTVTLVQAEVYNF